MPLRPLFLAALSVCLCGTALANERRYNVEIAIIENTNTSAGTAERWRPEVVVPDIEGAVSLPGPVELAPMVRRNELGDLPEGFEPLPSEKRKLGGAIRKLRESGEFRVLRHLAWQQPALGEEDAPRIRVHNGEAMTVRVPIRDFDELYALEDETTGDSMSSGEQSSGTDGGIQDGDTAGNATNQAQTFGTGRDTGARVRSLLRPVQVHPLDGTIRLVVSRYLHVYTDLYFTSPVEWTALPRSQSGAGDRDLEGTGEPGNESGTDEPSAGTGMMHIARGPDGSAMLSYPFKQHRRMRSGELHYLDHPVLGLLIRVDRAEEEETNEDSDGGE